MFLIWFGLWFRYGFGMFWMWFWYGFDMVWERSAFFRVPDGLASRKETETALGQPFGRFLDGFCGFDMVFDTILIRFWYDVDTVLICFQWVGFRKRHRNSPGTGFCGFDMILIRFWHDFDTILIWFRWVGFKSQVWPTSRITTETISKSYLKPYQHHNYPETIHNNKSYLKRIKTLKNIILKNLHPRDFGCYKNR